MVELLTTFTRDLNKRLNTLLENNKPLITGYPDFGSHSEMHAHLAFSNYYAARAATLENTNFTRKIQEEVNHHNIYHAQQLGLDVTHAGPHPNLYRRASKTDILRHEREALEPYLEQDITIYYDLPANLGVEHPTLPLP